MSCAFLREGRGTIAKLLMALTMALSALHAPGTAEDIVAAGDHYVMVDKGVLTLWSETNGEPGLQTAPVVVLGIVIAEPDTHLHL